MHKQHKQHIQRDKQQNEDQICSPPPQTRSRPMFAICESPGATRALERRTRETHGRVCPLCYLCYLLPVTRRYAKRSVQYGCHGSSNEPKHLHAKNTLVAHIRSARGTSAQDCKRPRIVATSSSVTLTKARSRVSPEKGQGPE